MSLQDCLKNDQSLTTATHGHWNLKGTHLFLLPDDQETAAPSEIVFVNHDTFTLDDFQTYKRNQPSEPAPHDALSDCMNKTKVIMDQRINQNDPLIRKLCTKRFKALLQKGFHTTQEEPMGFFDCDIRYETQDDYPKILQFGPAVSLGNCISVPLRLQFGTNPPFTKTWIYLQENGDWLADDLLTQKDGQMGRTSLAEELERYHPLGGSNPKN